MTTNTVSVMAAKCVLCDETKDIMHDYAGEPRCVCTPCMNNIGRLSTLAERGAQHSITGRAKKLLGRIDARIRAHSLRHHVAFDYALDKWAVWMGEEGC